MEALQASRLGGNRLTLTQDRDQTMDQTRLNIYLLYTYCVVTLNNTFLLNIKHSIMTQQALSVL